MCAGLLFFPFFFEPLRDTRDSGVLSRRGYAPDPTPNPSKQFNPRMLQAGQSTLLLYVMYRHNMMDQM